MHLRLLVIFGKKLTIKLKNVSSTPKLMKLLRNIRCLQKNYLPKFITN